VIALSLALGIVGFVAVAAAWDIARSKLARWDAIAHLRESFELHVKAMDARDERMHVELGAMRKVMMEQAAKADDLASVAREMRVAKNLGSARRS
jgi:hypothetical protein